MTQTDRQTDRHCGVLTLFGGTLLKIHRWQYINIHQIDGHIVIRKLSDWTAAYPGNEPVTHARYDLLLQNDNTIR